MTTNNTATSQRVKTPTLLQMEAAECGATCLAIILAYHGRYVLAEEAREACDVSRDGSKAINIIKAARRYGLEAHGANIDIDALDELELPCIAYWEFNHFIIIEGYSKKGVYINDPATGPRRISYAEFDRAFTGVVLEFTLTKDFQTGGKPEPHTLTLLWQRLKKSKESFYYLIFITLALAAPTIAIAIMTKIFIDHVLIDNQTYWLSALLSGLIITGVFVSLLTWVQQYYLYRYKMKIKISGTAQFFWHLIHLPMRFFQQRACGDLAERIDDYDNIAEAITIDLTSNAVGLLTMVLYALAMFALSPILALISIVIAFANFSLLFFVQRKMTDLGRRHAQDQGKLYAIEMNGMQIIETIKANSLENQFFNRWSGYHAKVVTHHQRIAVFSSLLNILPSLLIGLNVIIILSLGSFLIIHGHSTVGTIVAFQALLIFFQLPLNKLLELGGKLNELKGDLLRLEDVTHYPQDDIVGENADSVEHLTPSAEQPIMQLRNIQFGYSRLEPPILHDFSLTLNPGKRTAIVGPSGSGKSSIINLVCGLHPAWSGDMLVNNYLLTNISRAALAQFLGLVNQQIYLFEGTVRNNLTLWDPNVSDENLYLALQTACIKDLVMERGGLDARITEGGANLSGGQAQRIEIARALVKNPSLLLLDEATSAIDTMVEEHIYQNFKQRGCGLLIIAHRLSAIRDCDEIIYLDQGEIIERGTHAELMELQGEYHMLAKQEMA